MLESFFSNDEDLEYTGCGNTLLQDIFFVVQMAALSIFVSAVVLAFYGVSPKQALAYFGL